jgi:peptide/nickel transport system permease protein
MIRFILLRLVRAALTLVGVLTVSFFLLRLNGSPSALMLPASATAEDIRALDHRLGFDRPILEQFGTFALSAARLDLGRSVRQGVPAIDLVLERTPATLELALASFIAGFGIAMGLAVAIQLWNARWLRQTVVMAGVIRQAIPDFVVGVLLILVFSINLHWLPAMGRGGWEHLILPATAVATYELMLYTRLIDAALTKERRHDYVRTAQAIGCTPGQIVLRHMLPNALPPVFTVAGMNLGMLMGGLIIIETVFNWPGVGRLVIDAVSARDFPVVQAALFVMSSLAIGANLIADILHAVLDPRVRPR